MDKHELKSIVLSIIYFVCIFYIVIFLHEVGHLIGFIITGEQQVIGFNVDNILIKGGIFSWSVTNVEATVLGAFIYLLLIPILLEFSFLYKFKQHKIWYLISIIIHRTDIIMFISVIFTGCLI
ncbi:MAG: hypothetical protein ACFFC6_05140 [Promethearchaeota archaeon]